MYLARLFASQIVRRIKRLLYITFDECSIIAGIIFCSHSSGLFLEMNDGIIDRSQSFYGLCDLNLIVDLIVVFGN